MREDTQSIALNKRVTPSGVPLFGPLSLFWFSTVPPSGFPLFPLSGFPLDTLAQTNTHTHTTPRAHTHTCHVPLFYCMVWVPKDCTSPPFSRKANANEARSMMFLTPGETLAHQIPKSVA